MLINMYGTDVLVVLSLRYLGCGAGRKSEKYREDNMIGESIVDSHLASIVAPAKKQEEIAKQAGDTGRELLAKVRGPGFNLTTRRR